MFESLNDRTDAQTVIYAHLVILSLRWANNKTFVYVRFYHIFTGISYLHTNAIEPKFIAILWIYFIVLEINDI